MVTPHAQKKQEAKGVLASQALALIGLSLSLSSESTDASPWFPTLNIKHVCYKSRRPGVCEQNIWSVSHYQMIWAERWYQPRPRSRFLRRLPQSEPSFSLKQLRFFTVLSLFHHFLLYFEGSLMPFASNFLFLFRLPLNVGFSVLPSLFSSLSSHLVCLLCDFGLLFCFAISWIWLLLWIWDFSCIISVSQYLLIGLWPCLPPQPISLVFSVLNKYQFAAPETCSAKKPLILLHTKHVHLKQVVFAEYDRVRWQQRKL